MNPNDRDDDLWKVMGQAREPQVSEFFARNVLREVRAQEERKSRGWMPAMGRSWWKWALPASAAAVIALAAVTLQTSPDSSTVQVSDPSITTEPSVADLPIEKIQTSPDYDVIAELDTLLAFEKNETWLDSYASN